MSDEFYDDLRRIGVGNASRGSRDLVRFWRAHRAEVDAWIAANPEVDEPEPPARKKK
jgi:hypothetical protein